MREQEPGTEVERQLGSVSGPCRVRGAGRGSSYADAVTTCDFCGRHEPDDANTLSWSFSVENGRPRTYCEECSRANLRAMEGKLDSEWW